MEANRYRRPDCQWKCGLTPTGKGCATGPDGRGRCVEKTCSPRRTLRWWRNYLPIAFFFVTLGTIVVLNWTSTERNVVAPGALTSVHAQLIQNPNDPHRCAACHELDNDGGLNKWNDMTISAHSQTDRCLSCHARDLPGMKLATPHDLPVPDLEALSRFVHDTKLKPKTWLVSLSKPSPIDWHQHDLACSDCHREHNGPLHDLQALSSKRCQACHQNSFGSFSTDHPEFTDYPQAGGQSVAFDHRRHQDMHFNKSNAKFDCRSCHVNEAEQGRVGQVFRTVSFEKACASCHQKPIESSLPDGLVVFQLPNIDTAGLKQFGIDIGTWPSDAGRMMEGTIPVFMQFLLAGDDASTKFFESMPASGNLSDWKVDQEEDRRRIVELTQSTRRLLGELAQDGQLAVSNRLKGDKNERRALLIQDLLRGIPPDLFRQAYREWFDASASDRANILVSTPVAPSAGGKAGGEGLLFDSQLQSGDLVSSDDPLLDSNPTSSLPSELELNHSNTSSDWKDLRSRQHLPRGGWMIDRLRMAIVYIPTGHADPWLTAFLTLGHDKAKGLPANETEAVILERFKEECLQPNSLGRCVECHQALTDLTGKNNHRTLWQAKRFDPRVRELTRFDHGPHLLQPGLSDCKTCHRMIESDSSTAIQHRIDFASIRRSDCVSCHRPQAAGDHCTQCHNYHTHSIE